MSSLRHSVAFVSPALSGAGFGALGSLPPVEVPFKSKGFYRNRLKRGLDLSLGLMLAPVALPLVAGLWALVRLDGGKGFYGQPRLGKNGRVFTCWKLRTMVENAESVLADLCASDPAVAAEWEQNQKLTKDPRITRIGRFLRATSLDELPQLWNVLVGEMSLVGPRPFTPEQYEIYVQAGGRAYFALRPGITGFWQVDGRSDTSFVERVGYDENYAARLGLWSDLRYLARTALVVLRGTGR